MAARLNEVGTVTHTLISGLWGQPAFATGTRKSGGASSEEEK